MEGLIRARYQRKLGEMVYKAQVIIHRAKTKQNKAEMTSPQIKRTTGRLSRIHPVDPSISSYFSRDKCDRGKDHLAWLLSGLCFVPLL